MTKREFNRILRTLATKATKAKPSRLDTAKVLALPDETKAAMVSMLVRHRNPIVVEFLGTGTDRNWLSACGYMYPFDSAGFRFVGLASHEINADCRARAARAAQDDASRQVPAHA